MKTYTTTEFWALLTKLTERFETAEERDIFEAEYKTAKAWVETNWTEEEGIEFNKLLEADVEETLEYSDTLDRLNEEVTRLKGDMTLTESFQNANAITAQAAKNLNINLAELLDEA